MRWLITVVVILLAFPAGGRTQPASDPPSPVVVNLFEESDHQLELNNSAEANRLLKIIVEAEPGNPRAWYRLADTGYRLQLYRDAYNSVNRSLELQPGAVDALVLRCAVKLMLNDPQGAADDADAALAADTTGVGGAAIALAGAYLEAALNEDALSYLRKAPDAAGIEKDTLMIEALLALKRYREAVDYAQGLSRSNPGPQVQAVLADAMLRSGRFPDRQVAGLLEQAVEGGADHAAYLQLIGIKGSQGDDELNDLLSGFARMFRDDHRAWMGLGEWYLSQGDAASAVSSYSRAAGLEPDCADAHQGLCRAYRLAGDLQGAEAAIKRAVELDPGPDRRIELASLLRELPGRQRDHEYAFESLLRDYADHPSVLLYQGGLLMENGSYDAALTVFRQGGRLYARDHRFPARQADCLSALGEYRECLPYYRKALMLWFSPDLAASLAGAEDRAGGPGAGETVWREFTRTYPEDVELYLAYADYLAGNGNWTQALDVVEGLRASTGALHAIYGMEGRCRLGLQQYSDAARAYRLAIQASPRAEYYRGHAQALSAQGLDGEALLELNSGMERYPLNGDLAADYLGLLLKTGQVDQAREFAEWKLETGMEFSAGDTSRLAREAASIGDAGLSELLYGRVEDTREFDFAGKVDYLLHLVYQRDIEALVVELVKIQPSSGRRTYHAVLNSVLTAFIDEQELALGAECFTALVKAVPDEPEAYLCLSVLESMNRDDEQALATVEAGLDLDPGHYYLVLRQVLLTLNTRGPGPAKPLAREVLKHPALDEQGYELFLTVMTAAGDYLEQVEVADQAFLLYPGNNEIYRRLVEACYETGDYYYVLALINNPDYQHLELARRDELAGRSYLASFNYLKAVTHLEAAVEANPDSGWLWSWLGEAYYFLDEPLQARESLTRAIMLDDRIARAYLWLGFALIELNDPLGAEQALAIVETLPGAQGVDIAWCRLGQARLAVIAGNTAHAGELVEDARRYRIDEVHFTNELDAVESLLKR